MTISFTGRNNLVLLTNKRPSYIFLNTYMTQLNKRSSTYKHFTYIQQLKAIRPGILVSSLHQLNFITRFLINAVFEWPQQPRKPRDYCTYANSVKLYNVNYILLFALVAFTNHILMYFLKNKCTFLSYIQ